jgi:predicted nucleic acid-binding protein
MTTLARCQSIADEASQATFKAGVIVDTQVLIDFVFRTRPRHHLSVRFFQHMQSTETPVLVPGYAVFEYQSALQEASRDTGAQLSPQAHARHPSSVVLYPVSIDEALIKASAYLTLPYLRAGDLVFLALAAILQRPLVTEDVPLFKKASALNLAVNRIEGYLESVGA